MSPRLPRWMRSFGRRGDRSGDGDGVARETTAPVGLRRQVYDLTPEDLARYPLWEFALDEEGRQGQDEETVRPRRLEGSFDPNTGLAVVHSVFEAFDGSRYEGHYIPQMPPFDAVSYLQPTILTADGPVGFWLGYREDAREVDLARWYRRLRKEAAALFPLAFHSTVDVVNSPREGVVEGFYYRTSAGEIHVVR